MKSRFKGWQEVSSCLMGYADSPSTLSRNFSLNDGQRASLRAIASLLPDNGLVIADEVGMGKTCIAVEVARSVVACGGRVAILVPPGLGYQWHDELRMGQVEAPLVLRSLWQYFSAWKGDREHDQQPWFTNQVVVISHAFVNWRLGKNPDTWRWTLLSEFCARWAERIRGKLAAGRNRGDGSCEDWVKKAARSMARAIPEEEESAAWRRATELSGSTNRSKARKPGSFGRDDPSRPLLERCVGLGLGVFDLVIIDEAHKSRGEVSGLSRLLDEVVLTAPHARRLAMTATPVELDVTQWTQTLGRIGVTEFEEINRAIEEYAKAVKRVRQCPLSEEARDTYRTSSADFKHRLSRYLLRRDKRKDLAVLKFHAHSGRALTDYRWERDIRIDTRALAPEWRKAVCAAEALSVVTSQLEHGTAKRLRLTLGNGHGIASLIDQAKRTEEDRHQEEHDAAASLSKAAASRVRDPKREERTQWWLDVVRTPFRSGDDALFFHPAIGAAVRAIEAVTEQGGKVLVFGRFTLPLHRLVDLLNAREMLRRLRDGRPWPQSKVYGDPSGSAEATDWPAVRAAHRQLAVEIPLEEIDARLEQQYRRISEGRAALRRHLASRLEAGLSRKSADQRVMAIFAAFKDSIASASPKDTSPLALMANALHELTGGEPENLEPEQLAEGFIQLMGALMDRGEGDEDQDGTLGRQEAGKLFEVLLARLAEEFTRPQGGFARLMYGGTKPESRRMIQLAFNRARSFPKVLVAQSMVGREGLNLHKACRVVMLLHPEWNPGVTEQQIGRIDRVGSEWETQLAQAIERGCPAGELPRIEVCPVIFEGTYDEHNWSVLRERWDDLRAQLHGIVIPSRIAGDDAELQSLVDEIALAAPNFAPPGA